MVFLNCSSNSSQYCQTYVVFVISNPETDTLTGLATLLKKKSLIFLNKNVKAESSMMPNPNLRKYFHIDKPTHIKKILNIL